MRFLASPRRVLPSFLLTLAVPGGALLAGFAGSALRTGRLDPLDWLLPGMAAVLLLVWFAPGDRGWLRAGRAMLLVAAPLLALFMIAGTGWPWAGIVLLVAGLALAAGAGRIAARNAGKARWLALCGLFPPAIALPSLADALGGAGGARGAAGPVGVMTALPLHGASVAAAPGHPSLDSVGLRAPLWLWLERHGPLRPIDALERATLEGVGTLLLAQPRALAPGELVVLDDWVRAGGHAVILADPLLHWHDPRPLGHPARPPLTSLLDPLLAHWGLRLDMAEKADGADAVERRPLASGSLLQLSDAGRFERHGKGSACTPDEAGLIARCRIGAGQALLVADADWINDTLWTLAPDRPGDRGAWTSDAPRVLESWLRGEDSPADPVTTWLASGEALVRGLRASLLLLLLLALADALVARHPSRSHAAKEMKRDQRRNISKTSIDTG